MTDPKELEILSNSEIPEAVRAKIAEQLYSANDRNADRELERQRIDSDRRKFVWNTPIVAALAGLVTLSATFVFERLTSRSETANTIEIGQANSAIKQNESKSLAELEAEAKEREFQYEIVRSELTDSNKTNAERAEVLLFLVRAGVLNSLNETELREMAEQQIESPDSTIIPQLTPSASGVGGIVGTDDVVWLSEFDLEHPVVTLSGSVGRLTQRSAGGEAKACTAFLVDRDRIATATYCVDQVTDISSMAFELYPNGDTSNLNKSVFEITGYEHRNNASDDWQDGYTILNLNKPVAKEIEPLKLSAKHFEVGSPLAILYFRRGKNLGAVWSAPDCQVIDWRDDIILHGCDTGPGASGGPILDPDTQTVVAVHTGRHRQGAVAARINRTD